MWKLSARKRRQESAGYGKAVFYRTKEKSQLFASAASLKEEGRRGGGIERSSGRGG